MNTGTVTLENKMSQLSGITQLGIWLLSDGKDFFINFSDFPEFKNATIVQIENFTTDNNGDFHWPDLDIEIEKASLVTPKKYPLKFHP